MAKKLDGFYSAAHKLLHTVPTEVRLKLSTRTSVAPKTIHEVAEQYNCISCFQSYNTMDANIRGRILRGYLAFKDGKTIIQSDPAYPVRPCYHNGRMCKKCYPHFEIISESPTTYRTIQLLKDFSKELRTTQVITPGVIEREDALQEQELEQLKKDRRPIFKGRYAIEVGEVGVADEPIHVNAFRAFMLSRRGGVKEYGIKGFDTDINYANIKRVVI